MSPFRVLAVTPAASRTEVERAGQKLLALCAIGAGPTVDGVKLDADLVREALTTLRDPRSRLQAELALLTAVAPPTAPPAPLGDWLGLGLAAPPVGPERA